ncbi:single-strand binding protein [Corynebacterium glutamicum MB001]|uniref:Single-stranded DNA-binding protein n=1 Tax=Corynebacterium glutamicum (strain ATCC 13032 / DSM 20300 / JCM 1318 / BCRC 11384 / CCUG 27702 / LMG 3730 / NBRC 12168 / NCIMB 10025 / NRRL B-2784 / 534) TaxID=196627 RepID=SSB_CORGL|nr:single-stranded DNA-binding protein [Corynebacterium glutamicum]Q8NLG0.1 RecName: Full=Single-stranded DNA-binding protein; Short=SSB [Corynebacterium glutamicum ATCC 13032]AGT06678.1 single-strand binding protein [Corynebacterium glutamicum MB001]AIK86354.1 single-stranded DNA-binding protein [Corynebacterium glutamicum]AIK89138.1 single-stranded DNA-binding protein [Corynebacterium glutamicum]ARV65842.1 single-stranded DNA-binding protein [Corynebacterium glutamicum]ASW15276.1 single-str
MAIGDTNITVVGNIVADPELRFTPSGAAVANFRIASTPRSFNRQTNQWEDGEALFLTVNVWRQAAENVAESLSKGMRVIVTGRLKQRSYETREGEKRSVFEVEADEVGPSLTFAKADVQRTPRGGNSGGNYGGGNQGGGLGGNQGNQQGGFSNQNSGGFGGNQGNQQQSNQGGFGGNQNQSQGNNFNQGGFGGGSPQAAPDNDPWNSAPPAGSGGFGGADDEPPF